MTAVIVFLIMMAGGLVSWGMGHEGLAVAVFVAAFLYAGVQYLKTRGD